jgi:ankyrin repeat protein
MMIDWGDEAKPRSHNGRVGMDAMLKDARRGDLKAVKLHLQRDPSLLLAKSGGHNRTFLWEATRGNQLEVMEYLIDAGAESNVPGRIRAEIVVLLKPYCVARHRRLSGAAELLMRARTEVDIFSACFLGDINRVQQLLKSKPHLLTQEQEEDSVWRVTPLHFAVAGGQEELARMLIKRGAQVRPYTRLLTNAAVRMKHPELIPLLLEAGADHRLTQEWAMV